MTMVERLSRYRDFAAFLAKYGRTDFSTQDTAADAPTRVDAEAFVCDVEALGPTFIKLGQLL